MLSLVSWKEKKNYVFSEGYPEAPKQDAESNRDR